MTRVIPVSAETIQAAGFAVSGEFTGASVAGKTDERNFTTLPVGAVDQTVSPETTFQTITPSNDIVGPSVEGNFTTLSDGGNGGGDDNGGGGGGGGGGRRRSRVATSTPLVPTLESSVPVSGRCPVYITKFIRLGANNNPFEVLKLQHFLRNFEGFVNVPLSGVYDLATYRAVMTFQTRYAKDILTPWGIDYPTGYVYITTSLAINNLHCERDPATTLDLRRQRPLVVLPPKTIEPMATSTSTTTLSQVGDLPVEVLTEAGATGTSRLLTAALGVIDFFKKIPCWWWILLLLLIICYLTFELIRERRRNRPLKNR